MKSHTPGPWALNIGMTGALDVSATRPFRKNNISAGTPIICDVYRHEDADNFSGKANALLIAAAPELLSALKGLLALDNDHQRGMDDEDVCLEVRNARDAIAKALGHNA